MTNIEEEVTEQDHDLKRFPVSHVLEHIIEEPSLPPMQNKVVKNWTKENEELVLKWQRDIEETSLIFNEIVMNKMWWVNFILVTSLSLSVLITLLESLSITLEFLNQKWLGIGFSIAVLVFGGIATLLMGFLKIFNLELDVQNFSRYVEKLNNSWFLFEIELNVSPDQRIDANDFIKRADGQYLSLMQQSPSVSPKVQTEANNKAHERLASNYIWQNKFKNQLKHVLNEIV